MTYLIDRLHMLRNIGDHSFTGHADHSVDFMPISTLGLGDGAEETSGIGEVPLSKGQSRGSKSPRGEEGCIEVLMEVWISRGATVCVAGRGLPCRLARR